MKHDVDLHRGIGFDVDNKGNMTIQGDPYMCHEAWNEAKRLVEQHVKAAKIARNARRLYPQARMKTTQQNKDLVMVIET